MRRIRNFYYSRYRQGARTVISHEIAAYPLLEFALLTIQPKLIIELGTFFCGLTALFHETDQNIDIHTFDYKDIMKHPERAKKSITRNELAEFKRKVFGKNVHFYFEDILTHHNEKLIELLTRPEKKIFYCDNGNKVKEVNMYARYLNPGDYLGLHDWGFEIDYGWEGIKDSLRNFSDWAKINKCFEEKNCSTRFFWRH